MLRVTGILEAQERLFLRVSFNFQACHQLWRKYARMVEGGSYDPTENGEDEAMRKVKTMETWSLSSCSLDWKAF